MTTTSHAVIEHPSTNRDDDTTSVVDLTRSRGVASPLRSNHWRSSPRLTYSGMRRRYARRDRIYDRNNPGMVRERLDVSEETPVNDVEHVRERAYTHLTRAHAIIAYANAALCAVLSAVLFAFIVLFARGMLADVWRKARLREHTILTEAAQCHTHIQDNGCEAATLHLLKPALREMCAEWMRCTARAQYAKLDANSATIWAESLAETINAFTEGISTVSILVAFAAVLALIFVTAHSAYGLSHPHPMGNPQWSAATPSKGGGCAMGKGYGTPQSKRQLTIDDKETDYDM